MIMSIRTYSNIETWINKLIISNLQENKEYLKQEEAILQRVEQDVDYDIEGKKCFFPLVHLMSE